VILLPKIEPETADREIELYRAAIAASPGVICLTECAGDIRVHQEPGRSTLIKLGLRYLGEDDCFTLVEQWPGAPANPTPSRPVVYREVLIEFVKYAARKKMSISAGTMLSTLRKVYRTRHDGTSRHGKLDYVPFPEVLEAYFDLIHPDIQGFS
jgi:hypothetical protein